MGRSGRKGALSDNLASGGERLHWTETHPDRHMWSPGRLAMARTQTREEYEALYGRGLKAEDPQERLIYSPFLKDGAVRLGDISAIRSSADLRRFLDENLIPSESNQSLEGQPLFEALWEQEWQRVSEQVGAIDQNPNLDVAISYHWAEPYVRGPEDPLEIRQKWFQKIMPTYLERGYTENKPHSALAAYLEADGSTFGRNKFANMIRSMRSESETDHRQYFEEELLPEIRHLASPLHRPDEEYTLPSAQLAYEIWEGLREDPLDQETDLEKHIGLVAKLLREGGGDDKLFKQNPLLSATSAWKDRYFPNFQGPYPGTTVFIEAALELNWEKMKSGDRREAMADVADLLLRRQLRTVAAGLDRRDFDKSDQESDAWRAYAQRLIGGPSAESPLENLRPIFRGEGREDLFEDLRDVVDTEIKKSIQSGSLLSSGQGPLSGTRRPGYWSTAEHLTSGANFLEGVLSGKTLSEQILASAQKAADQGVLR